ncbi:MAG: polyamine aminopropyltransferase [Chloroflexota bacterium]|jgi:spermidine synthase|nr:polyamine aminopropyltransferase [Dehalococcoidia bacterium]MCS5666837.1 polyamine aminopropyltransferase [Dehalococcoidia bacterium]MEC8960502.1 polyamine aminopropyltransferase [Chloroflexota bacterium]MEC9447504.1 polyamine aminopropyltransferase [Chloroflexota bacterium]MEE3248577.1 polyamine aminopropyltransferase [Chloroflexota bacterium]|tara:strand:- start:88 stop:1002 length:915 start_codon:yes stop_codon:yes gene_type:complete
MMDISGNWFIEAVSPELSVMLKVRQIYYSGQTAYQKVEVLDSELFGRSLILDGKTQSTERDEHIYHETLVHPAMLCNPEPKQAFIGGGGEGGTLREVLGHKSVKRVTMVDLDSEVVALCREYLPNHHKGSFDDPRTSLIHQDARSYLQNTSDYYDVIILDLVDPLEGGTAALLYTQEFYAIAKARLNPGGVLVTQSGPAGLLNYTECFTTIFNTLGTVFDHTTATQVHIPAFQTLWGFTIASDTPFPEASEDEVDAQIASRLASTLKYYDGVSHRNMLALPKFQREGLESEDRINKDSDPVFML